MSTPQQNTRQTEESDGFFTPESSPTPEEEEEEEEDGECEYEMVEIDGEPYCTDSDGKLYHPDTREEVGEHTFLGKMLYKSEWIKTKKKKSFLKKVKIATPAPVPAPVSAPAKVCPEGKVLNPVTGRCIINRVKKMSKKKEMASEPIPTSSKLPGLESNRTTLYDVNKSGVMLAHTFKDPHTGIIKKPPKGYPQAPNGWYASEKFDGYRAIWDGAEFRSRTGKVFVSPEWFKKLLPKDLVLDGELFLGRDNFEKCGIFRRKTASGKEWLEAKVTYQIFDAPSINAPFEERQKVISDYISSLDKDVPLKITKQVKVTSEEDVYKLFDTLVSKGAEGVMLRSPGSPYDPKRSSHLLKVKPFFDAECKIIGYKEGSGKYLGKLGAFHCETIKAPNVKFHISGMNDNIRGDYLQSHPIGTIVTYTYVGITEAGIPRHPNYLRKRITE